MKNSKKVMLTVLLILVVILKENLDKQQNFEVIEGFNLKGYNDFLIASNFFF